jgi:hypothetical protein
MKCRLSDPGTIASGRPCPGAPKISLNKNLAQEARRQSNKNFNRLHDITNMTLIPGVAVFVGTPHHPEKQDPVRSRTDREFLRDGTYEASNLLHSPVLRLIPE